MVDIKRIKDIILHEIIGGAISLFFSFIPFIFSLHNTINSNMSYFEALSQIPMYIYVVFFIPLLVFIYIRLKMNEGKTNTINFSYFVSCQAVCYIIAFDMKWDVEIPKDELINLMNGSELIKLLTIYDNFNISSEPKCPICNVKLDYQDNLLWYTFDCFNCSFKKRTWKNSDRLTKHVNEIFKVKLENKLMKKK